MVHTADIQRLLLRELDAFSREIGLFSDDDALWEVRPGITNSAGTLALHLAGNLLHFVGAVLGGSGYVRDRAAEFSTRGWTRERVLGELLRAREAVVAALDELGDDELPEIFPSTPRNLPVRTDVFLLHLVAHAAFHLGQAGYLRRVVTGDTTSANPVSVEALVDVGPST
jgi:uncharacterized damage-inducible protein DinB